MSETAIAAGTCEHAGCQNVTIRFLERVMDFKDKKP